MKILLRLYPRAWRERYEREFLALLEDSEFSLWDAFDMVRGGVAAWLRPQVGAPLFTTGTSVFGVHSPVFGIRLVAACILAFGLVLFAKGPTPWAAVSYSDGSPQQPDHPIYLRSVPAADVLDYAFGKVSRRVPVTRAKAVHVGTSFVPGSHVTVLLKEVVLARVYESDNLTRCTAVRSPRACYELSRKPRRDANSGGSSVWADPSILA